MVIVREDLIGDAMPATPDLFKYEVQATVFRAPSAIKDPLTKRQLDSLARNDNAGFFQGCWPPGKEQAQWHRKGLLHRLGSLRILGERGKVLIYSTPAGAR